MRYCSLVQDVSKLDRYASSPERPAEASHGERYSDEQLYGLALYVYSLRPLPNPNRVDAAAKRAEVVFDRAGCAPPATRLQCMRTTGCVANLWRLIW